MCALPSPGGTTDCTLSDNAIAIMTENRFADSNSLAIRRLADLAFSRTAGAPLTQGNSAELLFDSTENFPAWLQAIESAVHSIMIEMYLIADDRFGQTLRDALIRRAASGVKVYLLYDALGSWQAHFGRFFAPLRVAGAEVRAYNPLGLMLLAQVVWGVTMGGCGRAGASCGSLSRSIAESRLPTSPDVSRAARGATPKTDSIICSTDVWSKTV